MSLTSECWETGFSLHLSHPRTFQGSFSFHSEKHKSENYGFQFCVKHKLKDEFRWRPCWWEWNGNNFLKAVMENVVSCAASVKTVICLKWWGFSFFKPKIINSHFQDCRNPVDNVPKTTEINLHTVLLQQRPNSSPECPSSTALSSCFSTALTYLSHICGYLQSPSFADNGLFEQGKRNYAVKERPAGLNVGNNCSVIIQH